MTITILPFVKTNPDGTIASLWNPAVTGDYLKDRQTGFEYAESTIKTMKADGNTALLAWIIRGFGENPDHSAIESGFCQRLAEHTLS